MSLAPVREAPVHAARAAPAPPGVPAENRQVAERLLEASRLLAAQGASPYRIGAYRNAADAVARHPRDVRAIFESEGVRGLDAIPRVGLGIAGAIAEMLATGHWSQLERLRGTSDPERLLQSVPGLGPAFARRIHGELHVDSLEGLEAAAHDGRLERLPGVGPRRASAWRASLGEMLRRVGPHAPAARGLPAAEPAVELILDVDREYREKAAAGTLRTIAPRRFNPDGEAWLPVLHARRGPWHFTALFSNTALAHRLGRVRDWVVVYFYDDDEHEHQRTVVTEPRGVLAGRRVVRGREAECLDHYETPTALP
ncbi:MAG TPA: helix-hairpin-helix domain-containing protein [Usitatibacter sp.]|nr:helix-hairpin-helix domain-containing protein [Usitatibacter sp.]